MFCILLDELLVRENVHIEFLLGCCLVLMVLIFAECNTSRVFSQPISGKRQNCVFRYLWSEPVIVRLTAVSLMNDFEFVPDFLNS